MPLPVIFFGHGNPMNALEKNPWTERWRRIGERIPRPRAILSISAHWYVPALAVTSAPSPATIHDFGGFPRALHEVQYASAGSPELAERVAQLLAPMDVSRDTDWGLDHGTWSVLAHVFPHADIPVVQLSLDARRPPRWHFETAMRLAPLRDEGVLIAGTGNLIHNLRDYAWGKTNVAPYDWAVRFEAQARECMVAGDFGPLVDYETLGEDARRAVPTPEHFLPLLYVLAQRREGEPVTFPVEGFDGGSISMLAVRVG